MPPTVDDLARELCILGVAEGDVVMVHASLRAIGPVVGGADTVVDALDAAVGGTGTVLMTLGALDDRGWVNERPERERPALLTEASPFDALRTPADPDVGVLAEIFRRRSGTLVSDHPEGRFGARGHGAAHLVSDVPWDDYYGTGSPLHRFVDAGGKVLRLGADPDTVTLLHYAEYLAPLAVKRRVRRHRVVNGKRGPEIRIIDCLDDTNGIVDWTGEDYFSVILRRYLDTGRAARSPVGRAAAELLSGPDLVAFAVTWMIDNLAPEEVSQGTEPAPEPRR